MELTSANLDCQLLSKLALGDQHGERSPYFDGWKAYDSDPFHKLKNPKGVGLAENQLSFDSIEEWIMKHPTASISAKEGVSMFKDIAIFQDYRGLLEFTNAVVRFMGKVRGGRVKLDPDQIVMGGELLMFCLADPGDAFLVPTPYYPAHDY